MVVMNRDTDGVLLVTLLLAGDGRSDMSYVMTGNTFDSADVQERWLGGTLPWDGPVNSLSVTVRTEAQDGQLSHSFDVTVRGVPLLTGDALPSSRSVRCHVAAWVPPSWRLGGAVESHAGVE